MDPQQTLRDIFDALIDAEPEKFVQAVETLESWLELGGFPPTVGGGEVGQLRTLADTIFHQ